MKTLTLKKKHFNSENFYIGKHDLSDFEGNVEISPKVKVARFEAVKVSGYLKGTYIFSNQCIEAGLYIKVKLAGLVGSGSCSEIICEGLKGPTFSGKPKRVLTEEVYYSKLIYILKEWYLQEADHRTETGTGEGSPHHSHDILGVWDSDNRTLSGTDCAECKLWNVAERLSLKM